MEYDKDLKYQSFTIAFLLQFLFVDDHYDSLIFINMNLWIFVWYYWGGPDSLQVHRLCRWFGVLLGDLWSFVRSVSFEVNPRWATWKASSGRHILHDAFDVSMRSHVGLLRQERQPMMKDQLCIERGFSKKAHGLLEDLFGSNINHQKPSTNMRFWPFLCYRSPGAGEAHQHGDHRQVL